MKSKIQAGRQEMGTLVCFALEQEAAPFRKVAKKIPEVAILLTGIGAKNAETALRQFLALNLPKQVLTCGFAGGLNPALKVGDVVFMTGYPTLEKKLVEAGAILVNFFSSNRIATTVIEKQKLRTETGADVVEMESGAILAVCRERRIPCAMVRAISDTAGEDLPLDFNQLSKPDKNLHFGRLALAIARSPWKIPQLIALQRKTQSAAKKLAAVLGKTILKNG